VTTETYILFCESPLEANKVDPDFEEEFRCAKDKSFQTILFNFEDLSTSDNIGKATKKIKSRDSLANTIYRGWMLTPKQYFILYESLISKNYKLINNPIEYQNCHYLPDSLKFIEKYTPKTVFEKLTDKNNLQSIINKAKTFGDRPVIIKDYVKSEKHDWDTACFVDNASNFEKLNQTINNFIRLRDKFLNEGLVIREFIELNDLTIHSKSSMPLTEEYRLFFFNNKLLGIYDYWEEGEYKLSKPDTALFEDIAKNIESNFFSMDIARKKNGELIIIELGDGQVAGLPDRLDKGEFYKLLKSCSS
jgi:hypothetical protein